MYIKYVAGGIGFFLTMVLFNFLFKGSLDFKVMVGTTVIYLLLHIIIDFIFEKKPNK